MAPKAAPATRRGPRRVRKPYALSYRIFATSPEVVLAAVVVLVSYVLLMTLASNTRVTGPGGAWSRTGQPALRHLHSRDAERLDDPPATVSVDLMLICASVLSVNALVGACVRVLLKEKRRFDKAQQQEAKDAAAVAAAATTTTTPAITASAATANGQQQQPAQTTSAAADSAASSSALTSNSNNNGNNTTTTAAAKGVVEYYFDEDMITNVLVGIGLVYSLFAAVFVQLQEANETRGYGAVAPMILLVGAIVCPRLGDGLLTVQHYCGIVYGLTLLLMLVVLARSAVSNAAQPPRLLAYIMGIA